jgi:hypothetical protein
MYVGGVLLIFPALVMLVYLACWQMGATFSLVHQREHGILPSSGPKKLRLESSEALL